MWEYQAYSGLQHTRNLTTWLLMENDLGVSTQGNYQCHTPQCLWQLQDGSKYPGQGFQIACRPATPHLYHFTAFNDLTRAASTQQQVKLLAHLPVSPLSCRWPHLDAWRRVGSPRSHLVRPLRPLREETPEVETATDRQAGMTWDPWTVRVSILCLVRIVTLRSFGLGSLLCIYVSV
jgi:hypothetical protein